MNNTPASHGKPAPPKPFYKQPAWIIIAAAALILILWANAWTAWYEQSTTASESLAPPKIVSPEKSVVAIAWLEQESIESRVRLWVLFENRSDTDALGLRFLTVQTPGYSRVGNCWTAEGPACISPVPHLLKQPLPKGQPSTLKKGQTVSVSALLEESGTAENGPLAASGFFTWRDSQGELENAFVVPAVQAVSRFDWLWFGLGKSVLFLKDLLVPAALAYLGWYLQHRDKQRDEHAATEKESKAEREKEQARIRETWNLMLPKSHANAERHYMPVAAAIADLLSAGRKIRKDSADEEWQLLLWRQLRFVRLMRNLALSIGGFYFRSLVGEEAAGRCWDRFLNQTRDRLGIEDLERVLEAIEPHESFAAFKDKLAGRSVGASLQGFARSILDPSSREVAKALAQLDTNLRCWAGVERGFQRNLPLLELLYVILSYEMNRPYEIWYGTQAPFEREAFWIALEQLELELETLQRYMELYLETVKQ